MTSPAEFVALPPSRRSGSPYAIAVVCLGNICRSPTAEVVLTAKLAAAGLDQRVVVRSAGTGDWHIGERMHPSSADTLAAAGYDPALHRAAQFDATWFNDYDLVLAMDSTNHADLNALAADDSVRARVLMFRSLDPLAEGDLDVPDPWYGGPATFSDVLAIVERTAEALVHLLQREPSVQRLAPNDR
ncbi:MAG: low molecular weight phosphotyrosine protein phosphatase [Nocardioidaceae bacterium]|nr:low molecular weight phosphotyrosine protein phosphatase [Nocardioidaceae bacterium]